MDTNSAFYKRLMREVEDIIASQPERNTIDVEPDFLISIRYPDGHIHNHFPNEEITNEIVADLAQKYNLVSAKVSKLPVTTTQTSIKNRKIVFAHKRALGDALMFSSGIRDFKLLFPHYEINVDSNQEAIWENNPHLNRELKKGMEGVEYYQVGYPLGDVDRGNRHFTSMFLNDMLIQVSEHSPLTDSNGEVIPIWQLLSAFACGDVGDPSMSNSVKNPNAREPYISIRGLYSGLGGRGFLHQCGDVHLTEQEKNKNIIQDVYGVDKYWVIAPGGKRDCTAKIWDWRKFQDVINHFNGIIKFVTIGRGDHLIEKLSNVIDLTDKFNDDIRGIFSLVYNADGCISGPSFLNHLAAAIPGKPPARRKACVTIWGGREPTGWCFYNNHQLLHSNGVYSCCSNGGCWKARTVPLQKDPEHNKNLCKQTVVDDGVTVQACMHGISSVDVIRAIEKYYEGDLYSINTIKAVQVPITIHKKVEVVENKTKAINILGNLNTDGGGEQSMCKIADVLTKAGWDVRIYPWGSVNDKFKTRTDIDSNSFMNNPDFHNQIRPVLPLLFYANDSVWDFVKYAEATVNTCSSLMIGINFMNGDIPKCSWLVKSGKLKTMVFQSTEKKNEFVRDALGFENVYLHVIPGAIDLATMLEVCPIERKDKEPLVVLKHGKADTRKYVTEETKNKGKKVHIWQQNFSKDTDVKFYGRLLKEMKDVRFEFMSAPSEIEKSFEKEKRMVFHKWNSMPVEKFLARGHVYLDRASNDWRHQYPRTIGEALAAGLPVLCEPRDGGMDRVQFGDSGFYCVDFDQYLDCLQKLHRKEGARHIMGRYAKDWARKNLRPENWVDIIEATL